MHFSVESAYEASQKPTLFTEEKGNSSAPRIASVRRVVMRKFTLREGNEETVQNHKPNGDRGKNISEDSSHHHTENRSEPESIPSPENASEIIHLINDCGSGMLSSKDQESKPNIRKGRGKGGTVIQHADQCRHFLKSSDAPRVTFLDPFVTRHSSALLWPKSAKNRSHDRVQAKSSFTPHPSSNMADLQDQQRAGLLTRYSESEPNPVLHPPRLTHRRSDDGEHREKPTTVPKRAGRPFTGICEKPMELLLNLVEEYWCGKNKGHDPKHFLVHAVRILRTMEQEAANGEEERKALRERIRVLRSRAEKQETCHQSEIQSLSEQLQKAHSSIEHLDQQLRSVLEENVSLQKELIRLEQRLFSDQLQQMPHPGE